MSDPSDFDFRDNLTGFTGLRRYFIYAVVAAANGREKWEFTTEPDGPNIRASVAVSEAGTAAGGSSATPYDNKLASVPLYRLFWNRVDSMLGKRPDWVSPQSCKAPTPAQPPLLAGCVGRQVTDGTRRPRRRLSHFPLVAHRLVASA